MVIVARGGKYASPPLGCLYTLKGHALCDASSTSFLKCVYLKKKKQKQTTMPCNLQAHQIIREHVRTSLRQNKLIHMDAIRM